MHLQVADVARVAVLRRRVVGGPQGHEVADVAVGPEVERVVVRVLLVHLEGDLLAPRSDLLRVERLRDVGGVDEVLDRITGHAVLRDVAGEVEPAGQFRDGGRGRVRDRGHPEVSDLALEREAFGRVSYS